MKCQIKFETDTQNYTKLREELRKLFNDYNINAKEILG